MTDSAPASRGAEVFSETEPLRLPSRLTVDPCLTQAGVATSTDNRAADKF